MDDFLVKKVILSPKNVVCMYLEGIDSKVVKMGGDCFVTSLNAGNGLFQQKVQKWR